ncbi:MAG TPA: HD domain-containing phosphohydrolase [Pyrinomonadaceae bacterium]|nr:HD domain-containing phosphohydrolase [Pyrinomonadaceae bacterium]
MPFKILLADSDPVNLRLLESLFLEEYEVLTAPSGSSALCVLAQHDVALLITEQRLPDMTGIELLKRTASMRPHMVRIILTGYADAEALVEAINCGQVYRFVTKPLDNEDLQLTVARALQHYEVIKLRYEVSETNKRLAQRLRATTRAVIRAIADTLEAKDHHVYGHARRVSGYAVAIGRRMRLSGGRLEQLSLSALMHDVGKIGTPDAILLKSAALTEEEHATVRLHVLRGARLLAAVPEMEEVAATVRHHHEDFDGCGYPDRLAGDEIPLASRIIRVADAYDAMTSPRPFRSALSHEAAVEELMKESGTQFDPEVVRAFCELKALAKIRRSIMQGDFGSQFLTILKPVDLWKLGAPELLRDVESEPALAASVLRAANAACTAEEATASLPEACARLGSEALRNIIAQTGASGRVNYEAEVLRDHSLRCAMAARLLAEKTGVLDPDHAYTAGLLHDLGDALLRSHFPEEAEKIVWLGHPFRIEKEVATFGVDHAQVGQWILDACRVPTKLALTVQTHHDITLINDPASLLLHVADAVASANDSSEVASLDALTPDRLALLGLSRADLARVHELITEKVGERFDGVAA